MHSRALKQRSLFPSHLESITGTVWKDLEHNGWPAKPGATELGLKAESGPCLVFVNKALLVHKQTHLFAHWLSSFSVFRKLSLSAECIPLYRERLLDLVLNGLVTTFHPGSPQLWLGDIIRLKKGKRTWERAKVAFIWISPISSSPYTHLEQWSRDLRGWEGGKSKKWLCLTSLLLARHPHG